MKALAAFVLLVGVVAACAGGNLYRATVREPDGSYPLDVVLVDHTGRVTAVEAVSADGDNESLPQVQQDSADPNAVIVRWATGACDDVSMSFRQSDAGYRLDVDAHERIGLGCTAQLLFRDLRIRFSAPVSADSIVALGGR